MTLAQVAAQIDLSIASVARIEAGTQPYTHNTLEALAEVLGVEPYQLIKGPPGAPDEPRTASPRIKLNERALERALDFAIRHAPGSPPAQIARTARVLYQFLVVEKKGDVA